MQQQQQQQQHVLFGRYIIDYRTAPQRTTISAAAAAVVREFIINLWLREIK